MVSGEEADAINGCWGPSGVITGGCKGSGHQGHQGWLLTLCMYSELTGAWPCELTRSSGCVRRQSVSGP